ncbi:hypothetical protein EVAR_77101_1 [Eumeta japonica]|uniref:Uncharacterized protein n=1 Tax=Eumeta variegata TaxID=151549 RepID=A0A4C1T1U6_EUMVA|nr:hypothetical protein EVAR_77101_1 [Eumeta japonica]
MTCVALKYLLLPQKYLLNMADNSSSIDGCPYEDEVLPQTHRMYLVASPSWLALVWLKSSTSIPGRERTADRLRFGGRLSMSSVNIKYATVGNPGQTNLALTYQKLMTLP